jgi:Flp pilus assembly protein TadD
MKAGVTEIARALVQANRPADALKALAPHLASSPDDVDALVVASLAQLGTGRDADALISAARAIAIRPDDPDAWQALSRARLATGDGAGARSAARQVVNLVPDSWHAHAGVAGVDVDSGGASGESYAAALEAVRLAPEQPTAHVAVGAVAFRLRRLDIAERAYREALRLDPDNETARHDLAVIALRHGRAASAADTFGDLLALDPHSELAMKNLGAAAGRLVNRFHFALLGTYLIGLLVSFTGLNADSWLTRTVLAVIAAGALAIVAIPILLASRYRGRGLRLRLRRVASADPSLILWAVLLGVLVVLMVAAVPVPTIVSCVLYVGGIAVVFAAAITRLIRGIVRRWG